jgi:hypothetical protein
MFSDGLKKQLSGSVAPHAGVGFSSNAEGDMRVTTLTRLGENGDQPRAGRGWLGRRQSIGVATGCMKFFTT